MRRFFGYIAVVLAVFAMTLSCRKVRVIPKDTLTDIYAEMFLADQWISQQGFFAKADTHYIYRPILEKYGYTPDDYRLTVSTYMQNPEDYAKIFESLSQRFDDKIKEIEHLQELERKRDSASFANNFRWKDIRKPVLYKDILKGQFPSDTVCFGPDSARYTINIPVLDTMFAGPRLVLRNEGTMVNDSTMVADSTVLAFDPDKAIEPDDKALPFDREAVAPLPLESPDKVNEYRNDARRSGLRTNNQQEVGRLTGNQPAAAERKAL